MQDRNEITVKSDITNGVGEIWVERLVQRGEKKKEEKKEKGKIGV